MKLGLTCKETGYREISLLIEKTFMIGTEVSGCFSIQNGQDAYPFTDYTVTLEARSSLTDATFRVWKECENWRRENFVFAPAALYNGNRYHSVKLSYPPLPMGVVEEVPDPPTVITDVPRLSDTLPVSKAELMVGDLTKPCFGYFDVQEQKAWFCCFPQRSFEGRDNSIRIEENLNAGTAAFSLLFPAKRENMYRHMDSTVPSDDTGIHMQAGQMLAITFRTYELPAENITAYLEIYSNIRKSFDQPNVFLNKVPFEKAFHAVEEKYNRYNWVENEGYYKSSVAEGSIFCGWQTGWCGGGMGTYADLAAGSPISKERALKNLDFLFGRIQTETGLFYGIYYQGKPYSDHFTEGQEPNELLMRKQADIAYFLVRQLMLLKQENFPIPPKWERGTFRAVDVLREIYEANGQFGQFVNLHTKELTVRGTSGGVMAIGALALGSAFFHQPQWLKIAQESGRYYYDAYLSKGLANGAPGETCQCPDSEAAFAFLESYMALYTVTGNKEWLPYAKAAANLASTWVVSYDFQFPENSQFYERGIRSCGAVWASVQNKHAAPGICTLSGFSLFQLYRATGEEKYLVLFREIAHNLTQFVSLRENPFYFSYGDIQHGEENPEGFSGERINLSDWEGKENVGEFPNGSCWCEVTMLLNYVDNPGIYIEIDRQKVTVLDHVLCHWIGQQENGILLEIQNPTAYDCHVKVLAETAKEQRIPLSVNAISQYQDFFLKANSTQRVLIPAERKEG